MCTIYKYPKNRYFHFKNDLGGHIEHGVNIFCLDFFQTKI